MSKQNDHKLLKIFRRAGWLIFSANRQPWERPVFPSRIACWISPGSRNRNSIFRIKDIDLPEYSPITTNFVVNSFLTRSGSRVIVHDGVDNPIQFHAGLAAPEAGKIGVRLIVRKVVFMVYF